MDFEMASMVVNRISVKAVTRCVGEGDWNGEGARFGAGVEGDQDRFGVRGIGIDTRVGIQDQGTASLPREGGVGFAEVDQCSKIFNQVGILFILPFHRQTGFVESLAVANAFALAETSFSAIVKDGWAGECEEDQGSKFETGGFIPGEKKEAIHVVVVEEGRAGEAGRKISVVGSEESVEVSEVPVAEGEGFAKGEGKGKVELTVQVAVEGALDRRGVDDFAKEPTVRVGLLAGTAEVSPKVVGGAVGMVEAVAVHALLEPVAGSIEEVDAGRAAMP